MNDVRRILVVVDNVVESSGIRALCSELPSQWKAYYSTSTTDAVSYLDQVDFDLIVVDLDAGPLAGAQFLQEVWARHPQTIRLLLGSAPDPDLMITCVMGSHQFVQKPLDQKGLQVALDRAEFMDQLLQDETAQALLARIRTFPTQPKIYSEVMKEINSPGASPKRVGELVSADLAISSKLLQVINSASFGLSQKVTSPADAVFLLGMQTTASLVLGIEAFSQLDQIKPLHFPIEQLWQHSQSTAQTSRQIAQMLTNESETIHEAFTAGLVHDIGKLALAMNLEDQYELAVQHARQRNVPLRQVEKEMLGATHAEAGAYLLSVWGLPLSVVQAVAMHHEPPTSLPPRFCAGTAVHLANALETARASLSVGAPEFRLDLRYPLSIGLHEHFEEIRNILSIPAGSGLTEFLKKAAEEARPAPPVRTKEAVPGIPFWKAFLARLKRA